MALAVLSRPLGAELCRRRGGAQASARESSVHSLGETQCGTFSFVFISSSDQRNPVTLSGKRREDGAYLLLNGTGKVTGVLIPIKHGGELEEARKSGAEIWGSMDTFAECLSDGSICLIKGINPHLFQQHFVLKRGVYKDSEQ
ncbi:TPA: hypothetical protein HA238_03900 [Candidatus Micrarchaeota archaeon]|nr:hypothetical protein [Candidatus Micrarchaeota archaeon]